MKTKKISIVALAVITLAILNINVNTAVSKDIQDDKTITIKLNSIQCDMCAEKVTDAINSVKGVEKVSVDLEKKNATVTYDTDVTSKKAIEKAITSVGYDANKKEADPEAYDDLSSCCKKP